MNTPAALDGLLVQLLRRGLPPDYARRAVDELADHHEDLVAELRAAGQDESQAAAEASRRLGKPWALVKKTVREYQRRYWCGRWPLLTFLLGPIPLMLVVFAAIMLLSFILLWPIGMGLEQLGFNVNPPPDGVISWPEYVVAFVIGALYLFLAPALALFCLAWLAKRSALGAGWMCTSAIVLAMFVGLWVFEFPGDIKPVGRVAPADEIMFVVGLPMAESWQAMWNWYTRDPMHIAQFLLPLGIAGVMVLRMRQNARRSEQLMLAEC